MNKTITLGITMLATLTLVGCSNNTKEEATTNSTPTQQSSTVAKVTPTSIDDFKTALESAGLTITEEREKEAAMIQAKSGKGFVLDDDSSVEVYEFQNNDMFKSIKNDKELLGMPATIIGNYVIIVVNETTHQQEIDKALGSFDK